MHAPNVKFYFQSTTTHELHQIQVIYCCRMYCNSYTAFILRMTRGCFKKQVKEIPDACEKSIQYHKYFRKNDSKSFLLFVECIIELLIIIVFFHISTFSTAQRNILTPSWMHWFMLVIFKLSLINFGWLVCLISMKSFNGSYFGESFH